MGLFGECMCACVCRFATYMIRDLGGRRLGDPLGGSLGGPLGGILGQTLGRPLGWGALGGALGVALADPWGTLGGSSEDLWWTLENDCGSPSPQTSGLPRCVYTYIGLKNEVCVHVEIAKVCIHVPAPKSAVCAKEQIAKVCIGVPGPETEVCAKPCQRGPESGPRRSALQ